MFPLLLKTHPPITGAMTLTINAIFMEICGQCLIAMYFITTEDLRFTEGLGLGITFEIGFFLLFGDFIDSLIIK